MHRIRKALVKPKRLKAVFDNHESVMQVQIARLCVLYEDLRIEILGAGQDQIAVIDENSAQYRKLYFLRRAVATLVEMDGALHKLDMDPEFKVLKRTFAKERLRQWKNAIRCFAKVHRFLNDERNMYGGHFHDDVAAFALEKLDPDRVELIDITFNTIEHTFNTKYLFALEFVGIGFTVNRGDKDADVFVQEAFDLVADAMRHAGKAVHVVNEAFILPRFGV